MKNRTIFLQKERDAEENGLYIFHVRSNPSRRVLGTLLRANGLGENN